MKGRPLPDWEPMDDYDEIAQRKKSMRSKRLHRLRPKILRAYRRYEDSRTPLDRLRPCRVKSVEANVLRHGYTVSTAPLRALKARLREIYADYGRRCPYCGVGTPDTFDHYLPKERFPEFSSLAHNLIPCCFRCNTIRGDRDRELEVIHVSFERVDSKNSYLMATLDMSQGSIDVRYSVRPDTRSKFARRLAGHLTALQLYPVFRQEALAQIGDLECEAEFMVRRSARRKWKADLPRRRDLASIRLGANHWKTAFFRAASCSGAFIDHLVDRAVG